MAICQYRKTESSETRMAALLAQQETRDRDGRQVSLLLSEKMSNDVPVILGLSSWISSDRASLS